MRARQVRAQQRPALSPGLQLLLFTGLVATLLTLVGVMLAWRSYQNQRSRTIAEAAGLADTTAAAADRFLVDRIALLQALAAAPPVQAGDRAAMVAYFNAAGWEQLGLRSGIGWADTSGQLRVSTALSADSLQIGLSDRDYVRAVLTTDRPYVGQAVIGRATAVLTLPVAVPTHDMRGAVNGVLIGSLRLDAQETFLRDLSVDDSIIIIDRAGQIISAGGPVGRLDDVSASPLLPRLRGAERGVLAGTTGLRGEPNRLIGFATTPTGGWLVLVDLPLDDALAPARRVFIGEVGGLLLLALVGMGGVAFAARRLNRAAARDQATQQRYRTLAEAAPVGIFHASAGGDYTFVSERWCAITGLAPGEVLGRDWLSILHPDDRARLDDEWQAAVRAGEMLASECRLARDDGAEAWVLLQATVERDTAGKTIGYVGTLSDVSTWHRTDDALRTSERKFSAAFALSPQAISITVVPSGEFIEVNDALLRMSGYRREEVLGNTPLGIGLWADPEVWEQGRDYILREGRIPQREVRLRNKHGGIIIGLASAERILIGEQPAILTVITDITDRRRVEDRARLLAEAGTLLAGTLDESAALAALARLLVADIADWCLVSTLEEDGQVHRRAFAHTDPAREPLLRQLDPAYPFDPGQTSGVAGVIASGQPRFDPALRAETLAGPRRALIPALRDLGVGSGMIVPLRARGSTFGAISLLRADPARPYTEEELALAEQIADRAAVALDSARLYAAERAARAAAEVAARRQAALAEASRLFAASGAALQPLLDATARYLVDLLGDGCLIGLTDDDGEHIAMVVADHRDPDVADYSRATFIGTPMRVGVGVIGGVVASGQPALLPVIEPDPFLGSVEPALREAVVRYAPCSLMVTPCRAGGRIIGAIAVARHTPDRPYAPDDLALLNDLADRAALAIDRARFYEAERQARAEAEAAQSRLRLLADAGALLVGALDEEATVETLAHLIVPDFADWCTINLLGDDGLRPPIALHADPEKQAALDELLRRYPADLDGDSPLATAIRTGESFLAGAPAGDLVREQAHDDDYLALLAQVGLASTLIVPLQARERLLGALRFARAATSPPYDDGDRQVAEVLVRRAAFVLDNASLYRETREAIAARDRFLSIAAHELRTPVTSMRAYGQLVRRQRDRGQLTPALIDNALAAVERGTTRLDTLIQDLLDVARLQSGQLRIEPVPFDLVAVLETAIAEARTQLPANLQLTFDRAVPAYTIRGDIGRLEQVLGNLLENARKYSPEGGTIAVTLATDERGATIAVADEGIGLEPGEEREIFIPFNRSDEALRRQIQGLGLGLAICRAIVEEHRGTLEATSAGRNRGTVFTLWLPAGDGPLPAATHPAGGSPAATLP